MNITFETIDFIALFPTLFQFVIANDIIIRDFLTFMTHIRYFHDDYDVSYREPRMLCIFQNSVLKWIQVEGKTFCGLFFLQKLRLWNCTDQFFSIENLPRIYLQGLKYSVLFRSDFPLLLPTLISKIYVFQFCKKETFFRSILKYIL